MESVVVDIGVEISTYNSRAYRFSGAFVKSVSFKAEVNDFVRLSFVLYATSKSDIAYDEPDSYINTAPAVGTTLEIEANTSWTVLTELKPIRNVKKLDCVFETGFLTKNAWIDTAKISEKDYDTESSVTCSLEVIDDDTTVAGTHTLIEQLDGWIPATRIYTNPTRVNAFKLSFRDADKNPLGYLTVNASLQSWNCNLSMGTFITSATLGGVYSLNYKE
jgi:hypothetical protein